METEDPHDQRPRFDPSRLHYSKWQFRFTMGSFILWITIFGLVLGNMVTGALLMRSRQELKRAEKETGFLVYGDESLIHFRRVPVPGRGVWQFRVHLPEGRQYRVLHHVNVIPDQGYPKIDSDSVWSKPVDGGDIAISLVLDQELNGEWRLYRTIEHVLGASSGTGMDLHLSNCDWIYARNYMPGTRVYEIDGNIEASVPHRYLVFKRAGGASDFFEGQKTFAPDQIIDLLRLRVTEVDGPQPRPQSRFDIDYDVLERSANFTVETDGIMLWIEPVTVNQAHGTNRANN